MSFPVGVLVLMLVTLAWGTSFAVVKEALETIPVPLLLALRFSLTVLLFAWVPFRMPWGRRRENRARAVGETVDVAPGETRNDLRSAIRPAFWLGLLAFAGFGTQTVALTTAGASEVAFITGLSVILTPMISATWFRNRVPARGSVAGVLALAGLGLLTIGGSGDVGGIGVGELWALACAFSYAGYIVYLGEVAGKVPALALAGLQHVPMAVLAWIWAAPSVGALATTPLETYLAIVYLAAVCTALVAVLQTYAQRVVPAYLAALIFVLEPVFAALFAYLLLGERLGVWGWVGGAVVVVAMLVAELRLPRAWRVGGRSSPPV